MAITGTLGAKIVAATETEGKPRVLVIEDEADIRDLMRFNLEREGCVVDFADDGEKGLELARTRIYDAILLDLMLPGLDGMEVCRALRDDPRTKGLPVVMVPSRGEEQDVVLGLDAGADDYVTKPFSMKELVARVKSAVRRNRQGTDLEAKKPIRRGNIEIDVVRHEVRVDGEPVILTLSEFRLLHHLMRHAGRVFTRSDLLPHVVGHGVVVVDRNIDVHVRNIRRKLGRDAARRVSTVRGIGYKFL
jgi:DNA-binding response OmpR family regulator